MSMRLKEMLVRIQSIARAHGDSDPVLYVETEDGVLAPVVSIMENPGRPLGLREDKVIVIDIGDPEDGQ